MNEKQGKRSTAFMVGATSRVSRFKRLKKVLVIVVSVSLMVALGFFVYQKFFRVDYKKVQAQAQQKTTKGDYAEAKKLLEKARDNGGKEDYTIYFNLADVANYLKSPKDAMSFAETGLRLYGKDTSKDRVKYTADALRMQTYLNSVYIPPANQKKPDVEPSTDIINNPDFQG